jgi:hypothetical protein
MGKCDVTRKGLEIAKDLNYTDFKGGSAYVHSFCKRFKLSLYDMRESKNKAMRGPKHQSLGDITNAPDATPSQSEQ